jgi:hypothetical protein
VKPSAYDLPGRIQVNRRLIKSKQITPLPGITPQNPAAARTAEKNMTDPWRACAENYQQRSTILEHLRVMTRAEQVKRRIRCASFTSP